MRWCGASRTSCGCSSGNLERDKRLAEAGAVSARAVEADSLAVSQSEASLAEANARQVVARRVLERSTVRAPFAGIVSDQTISVGDVVKDGTELFTILDPSSLRLEGQVPAEALRRLKVGTPVQFTAERIPGRAPHRTREPHLSLGRSGHASGEDPGGGAEPAPGTGRRPLRRGARDYIVSQGADGAARRRSTSRGAPMVVQLKGGRLQHTEVATGLEDAVAELVEVTSGLAAGDTIVLGSSRGIPDGHAGTGPGDRRARQRLGGAVGAAPCSSPISRSSGRSSPSCHGGAGGLRALRAVQAEDRRVPRRRAAVRDGRRSPIPGASPETVETRSARPGRGGDRLDQRREEGARAGPRTASPSS